jgi:hypothetical protein
VAPKIGILQIMGENPQSIEELSAYPHLMNPLIEAEAESCCSSAGWNITCSLNICDFKRAA